MQIHELNNKKSANISEQQVNEIDLFGPQGIAAVGKQVLKNPKAFYNAAELGAAKQAAAQDYAAKSAEKLANPSAFRKALGNRTYNVGGTKPTVTIAQQLQAVKSNPGVQQQVKTLASQWLTQSAQLRKVPPVSEAAVAKFNIRDLTDPKYASVLKAIQARDAAQKAAPAGTTMPTQPYQVPGAGTSATPSTAAGYKTSPADKAEQNIALEKALTVWENQFLQWTDQKLASQGVTMDMIRKTPATAEALRKALSNVAVAAQSGDPKLENQAVEDYLNLAIAGIQAYVSNTQGSQTSAAAGARAADTEESPAEVLQKSGLTLSSAQINDIAAAMARAGNGKVINNTGNTVLNALAQVAGFRVANK